eukprot:COSAG06_NODE_66295_length_254_cov_1.645161_1_plen_75_part_01
MDNGSTAEARTSWYQQWKHTRYELHKRVAGCVPVAVQYCDRKTKPLVSAPFIHTGCEFSYAPRRVAVLPRESGAR